MTAAKSVIVRCLFLNEAILGNQNKLAPLPSNRSLSTNVFLDLGNISFYKVIIIYSFRGILLDCFIVYLPMDTPEK